MIHALSRHLLFNYVGTCVYVFVDTFVDKCVDTFVDTFVDKAGDAELQRLCALSSADKSSQSDAITCEVVVFVVFVARLESFRLMSCFLAFVLL